MFPVLKYETPHNMFWLVASELVYKLAITYRWVSGKRYRVTLSELARIIFLTNRYSLGSSQIRKVLESGDCLKIYLDTYSNPFHFRKKNYWTMLYILGENFSPISWHYYETPQTPISKNDIVADCGAGIGTFTLSASKKAKKVYAIEPFGESLQLLRLTFKNNKRVTILPIAVGAKTGKAYMGGEVFGGGLQNSPDGGSCVSVTTIDKLFYDQGKRITYLKADLEGSEIEMLKGASKTIREYKPKIAITTYHKKDDHIKIMNSLKKMNPSYNFSLRGIDWRHGNPIMLHAW